MSADSEQVVTMIENLSSPQKEICAQLRTMIQSNFPNVEEKWRWSRPIYSSTGKNICYMVVNKHDVNFGFDQGVHLDDPKGLLAGTGSGMRHIKIRKVEELDLTYYQSLLAQAIQIASEATNRT